MSADQASNVFCLASNDGDFSTLAECTRRNRHDDDHHCDTRKKLAWNADGPVECWREYDHGQPPNRTDRRGNTTLRPRHLARIRRNGGAS